MNKKKIGIITFHDADNCGAVLQAYALEKALEKIGETEVEIIDYKCEAIDQTKKTVKQNGFIGLIKALLLFVYYFIKSRGFDIFREKFLNLSARSYNRKNIKEANNCYDLFITGSDQVWNPECSGYDPTFVLDFVDDIKKKSSYAASLGNFDLSKANLGWIDCIRTFSNISVREESSVSQLEKEGINNIFVNADPVFLISEDDWKMVMSDRMKKQKYVFVYLILPDVNVMKQAEKYAKKTGCLLVSNKHTPECFLRNSPSDFLSWIYYSECVFTNSFHATAFSLLFNKPFFADTEIDEQTVNHRVINLLIQTDTQDFSCVNSGCEYRKPNSQRNLENIRESSLQYLKEICK